MMDSELIYQIAITKIDGIGPNLAKNLIAYCGSASAVFKQRKTELKKIPGIGSITANNISKFKEFNSIEMELKIIQEQKIKTLFYLDSDYPQRLKHCDDCPLVLFYKGHVDLNAKHIISVVGTRKSTLYGKQFLDEFIQSINQHDIIVVSGLATGTDTNAHKESLKNKLPTVGVLGHGLGTVYPSANYKLAQDMVLNGGLLSEYFFHTPGSRENFPKRNRIVAGMCDALIVVESGTKGGSLITADLANQYNRDVFALPGKINDFWSQGCNRLIHKNQAAIISNIESLIHDLNLASKAAVTSNFIPNLFNNLDENELKIMNLLNQNKLSIDDLFEQTNIEQGKLALMLLNLEFKNLISVLPGKLYVMNRTM